MNQEGLFEASIIDAPIVRIVDDILNNAIHQHASDIHIEPIGQQLRIRLRIDGILHDQSQIVDLEVISRLVSRVKVLASIDIAQKRVPQDGKFRFKLPQKQIDLRVSTFPSLYGEKVVIRILDRSAQIIHMDSLGFSAEKLALFEQLLTRPQGFILVCGPTGSGKTTTLYSALSMLNSPDKHIITLEDPIEYSLDGVTQGQVHSAAGFTFAHGMRSLLRQDPDIVMVGEMRDKESARIALEAAMTGHLVLSTIHTNDAPSVVMRLMDMGIEPFLINASLTGVLAQRLARKICPQCKVAQPASDEQKRFFAAQGLTLHEVYQGVGCNGCYGRGYKGRIGIFELLTMTSALRSLIVRAPVFDDVLAQARSDGMQTLLLDGARKVIEGTITFQELLRVVC